MRTKHLAADNFEGLGIFLDTYAAPSLTQLRCQAHLGTLALLTEEISRGYGADFG